MVSVVLRGFPILTDFLWWAVGKMKNLGEKLVFISLRPAHSTESFSLVFSKSFQSVEGFLGCYSDSAEESLRV
jgi:hypothetical protein